MVLRATTIVAALFAATTVLTAQIAPIGTQGAYPDLALDDKGNLHLVYARSGKTYYRMLAKGASAWGPEEATGANASTDHRQQPDIAIDSRGVLHVMGGSTYVQKVNGTWTSPQAPGISRDHHITVDSRDTVWVVYRGQRVSVRSKPVNSTQWSAPQNIYTVGSTDHIYPDITAGTDGSVHLVFRMMEPTNYDCGYMKFDGTRWSAVEWACLKGRPKMEEGPHIALDANNVPHVAMPEGNLRYNVRTGSGWQTPVTVANSQGFSRAEPTIAIDNAGNRYIGVWGGNVFIYNAASQSWAQRTLPGVVPGRPGFVDVIKAGATGAYMVYETGQTVNKDRGAGQADLIVVHVKPDGTMTQAAGGTRPNTQDLSMSAAEVSASAGGAVVFTLDAGPSEGGHGYALLVSASGTTPGESLPNAVLPLNLDAVSRHVFRMSNSWGYESFVGWLDGAGTAQATLRIARGELRDLIGFQFHLAFLTVPVTGYASNAVTLRVSP